MKNVLTVPTTGPSNKAAAAAAGSNEKLVCVMSTHYHVLYAKPAGDESRISPKKLRFLNKMGSC